MESEVIVLGLTNLAKLGSAGLTNDQIPLLRDDILSNALKTFENHDDFVKIIDPSYNYDNGFVTARFMYSEDEAPITLQISVESVYVFNYKLLDGRNTLYSSERIIFVDNLGGDDYTGDGTPPEER